MKQTSLQTVFTVDDAEKKKIDLHSLQIFNLTISFEPTTVFLARVGERLKKAFGIKTVLSVTIDSNIVGGAIVSFRGHYLDLSFKKGLDKWFEGKNEIF